MATVTQALKLARPGDRIELAAGTYPSIADSTVRSGAPIRIGPAPGAKVTVRKIAIQGGQGLAIHDLSVRGTVMVNHHWSRRYAQRAERIELRDLDISSGAGGDTLTPPCVSIRGGSRRVTLGSSVLHDCAIGVYGSPTDRASDRIAIVGNTLRGLAPDGIQIGAWRNVTIRSNLIEGMSAAGTDLHTDAIQLMGNMRNVDIDANVLRARRRASCSSCRRSTARSVSSR